MNKGQNLAVIIATLSLTACMGGTAPRKPFQTELYPGQEIYAKIECENIKPITLSRIYNKTLNHHEITSTETNSNFYYEDSNNGLNIIREIIETHQNCKIYYKNILDNSKLALLEKDALLRWTKTPILYQSNSNPELNSKEITKYDSENETPESIEFKLKLLGLREMKTLLKIN